jgi:Lrp/AsnC family leucine-responsive transcriptional regulator
MRKNPTMDDVGRQIIALLIEDARRSYDDIARRVSLSAPAVKRRVDRMRADGAIRGFSAIVDPEAFGWRTEALVELFYAPGTQLHEVAASLARHPEIVEAWSVTGDADAIARVRTVDNADLERFIADLQLDGQVIRTRSQVIMRDLLAGPRTDS